LQFIRLSTMHTQKGTNLDYVATLLKNGEVAALPTETVYGLAGNALNPEAVVKIYAAKNRPSFNPLIVHCASWQQAQLYVQKVPVKAMYLAERFTPGPLTFLLGKKDNIPAIVTAGSAKVAIRIPRHPLFLSLLNLLEFPLAAPSANPFGYISPTTAEHVANGLNGKIPYILDGGKATVGVESTIIGFEDNRVVLYRAGGVAAEAIEEVLQEKLVIKDRTENNNPETPGQLASHYAPATRLLHGNVALHIAQYAGKKIAIIGFHQFYDGVPRHQQYLLSPDAHLNEAAANLFNVLHKLDKENYDLILAEIFPDEGLGRAINDRLKRAAV
jgi:L-threonylcarbamoyladenylate synthase